MSRSPSWVMRCALILLTLIVPVNSTVTLEPTALFFVLAFPVLGSLYLMVTVVLSALCLLLGTLLTVSAWLFRGLLLVVAAPRLILHVHRHAYKILYDRIRRTKRACKVFVVTFVKTLARQLLLAFLRPIGFAVQAAVVWATTLLIDTLTAVVLGAGYAVVCGVKLVWGRRWTPVSVFWAGLAGFKTMVCDVYKIAKADAQAAYYEGYEHEMITILPTTTDFITFTTDYTTDITISPIDDEEISHLISDFSTLTISDLSYDSSDDSTDDESDFSDLDIMTPAVSTSSLALDDVCPESTGLRKLALDDVETTDAPSEIVPCTQHAGYHSRDAPRGTFRTVRTWWRS
ncbi:hypothetical protein C8Q76DRAFT_791128 [Earliella scabrosa]|nr:hypothetical protein C8Q76DRAFT_791128 [Earliella scabrosa]